MSKNLIFRSDEYSSLKENPFWGNFFNSNRNFFGIKNNVFIESDVFVTGDCALIADQKQKIIDELLHEAYYWTPKFFPNEAFNTEISTEIEISQRRTLLQANFLQIYDSRRDDYQRMDVAVYLLHPFSWYAFGHLNDTLLRIKSLQGYDLKKVPFLVSRHSRIVDFDKHLYVLLGFKPILIEMPKQEKLIKVDKLIIPVSDSVYTTFTKDNYIWMREKYLDFFNIQKEEKAYKLYLARNHVAPGSRSVINHDQLESSLIERGFIVLTGKEPLQEIINYFYNAECVVGYHGSLFANLFYSQAKCKVIEYCAQNRVDYSFKNKFKLVQNYDFNLIPADEKFNANIDLVSLHKKLSALGF
jgi:hypothetical protein